MNIRDLLKVRGSYSSDCYAGVLTRKQALHLLDLLEGRASTDGLQLVAWWRINSFLEKRDLHFRLELKGRALPKDDEVCQLYDGSLKIYLHKRPGVIPDDGEWSQLGRTLARALMAAGATPDDTIKDCLETLS